MAHDHHYTATITWTGNQGEGTAGYKAYSRDHEIHAGTKPVLPGSSDPAFRGDPARYNPEDLLVASVSSCHMLWYLHLCATQKVVVTDYVDAAEGVMSEDADGSGRFRAITLRPRVTISRDSDPALALRLHTQAHHFCFIANSVNFPIHCEPVIAFTTE